MAISCQNTSIIFDPHMNVLTSAWNLSQEVRIILMGGTSIMLKLIVMEWPVLLTIIIKNLAVSYAENKQYNYGSARCIGSANL